MSLSSYSTSHFVRPGNPAAATSRTIAGSLGGSSTRPCKRQILHLVLLGHVRTPLPATRPERVHREPGKLRRGRHEDDPAFRQIASRSGRTNQSAIDCSSCSARVRRRSGIDADGVSFRFNGAEQRGQLAPSTPSPVRAGRPRCAAERSPCVTAKTYRRSGGRAHTGRASRRDRADAAHPPA